MCVMLTKLRFLFTAICFFTIVSSIFAQTDGKCEAWVDSVFNTMSPDERIGQLFVYNTPAQTDARTLNTLLKVVTDNKVGGLLFWDGSLEAQAELTNLAQAASKVPLMVTLDGEWGLYMRLKNGLRYPKKMTLSALADEELIFDFGAELGRQCQEMRINVNFDPVLDVNLNPENPVINTRAFSDNPQDVTRRADIFIRGLHSRGVKAVGKHFPGHGDTSQDSHHELAIVTHNRAQLDSIDLYPYKKLLNTSLDGVMVGHISVPAIDSSGVAASLSPLVIDSLLKKELKFKGLVFTDAMKMKAVSELKDGTVQALLAGNDVILDPMYLEREITVVKKALDDGRLKMEQLDAKCKRILRFKYECGLSTYKPINLEGLESRVNTIEAKRLQAKLAQQSITIFKNEADLLPLKDLKNQKIALVTVGTDAQLKFKEMIAQYDTVSTYSLNSSLSTEMLSVLDSILLQKDLIIFSVSNTQVPDTVLAKLCSGKKKVLIAYFVSPYQMSKYSQSTAKANACILAYENLVSVQMACAQTIFGGISVTGKLPVLIKDLCSRNKCVETSKIRLGYGFPEDVGLNSVVLSGIDSIVNDGIAKGAMPGCQVLVARKGVVVFQRSYGYHDYSNTQTVKNTDLYDLASVTKISATLPSIMKLYDEEKIKLDEKVYHYLPELKKTNKKNIPLYDLLTHQAGLPAFVPFYQQAIDVNSIGGVLMSRKKDSVYSVQIDKGLYVNKNYRYKSGLVSSVSDSLHSLQIADSLFILPSFKDSIWERIKRVSISEDKKYVYSDLSFLILQRVVERMSNRSLDEYASDNFYQELGASSVTFNPSLKYNRAEIVPTERDSFLRKQLLRGYVHDQNAAFMGGVAGHAGLFANANDLAKLYQMYLNGGSYGGKTFLSKETCAYFTSYKTQGSRRGLGFDRHMPTVQGDSVRASDALYGHTGFTGTCVWVDPKEEIVYIFLSNRVNPESWNKGLMKLNIRGRIEDKIYEAIIK